MKTISIDFGLDVTVCSQAREDACTASVLDLQEQPSIPNAWHPATGSFGHEAQEVHGIQRFQRVMANGIFVCDQQERDKYEASFGFFTAVRKSITSVVFNGVSESFRTVVGCPSSCLELFSDRLVRLFKQAGYPEVTVCPESEAALLFYHFCNAVSFHDGDHVAAISMDGCFIEVVVMQIKDGVAGQPVFVRRERYAWAGEGEERPLAAEVILSLKEARVPVTSFLLYGQDVEKLRILKNALEKDFSCTICFEENKARTVIAQGLALFGRPLTISVPEKTKVHSPRRNLSWKKLATILLGLFLISGGCFLWSHKERLLEKMMPAEARCELCLEFTQNNTLGVYFNEEMIWADSFTLDISSKVFTLNRPRSTENLTGDSNKVRLKIGENVLLKADPYLHAILRQKKGWLRQDEVFEKKAPLSEAQIRSLKKGQEVSITFDGTGCSLVLVPMEEKGR